MIAEYQCCCSEQNNSEQLLEEDAYTPSASHERCLESRGATNVTGSLKLLESSVNETLLQFVLEQTCIPIFGMLPIGSK